MPVIVVATPSSQLHEPGVAPERIGALRVPDIRVS